MRPKGCIPSAADGCTPSPPRRGQAGVLSPRRVTPRTGVMRLLPSPPRTLGSCHWQARSRSGCGMPGPPRTARCPRAAHPPRWAGWAVLQARSALSAAHVRLPRRGALREVGVREAGDAALSASPRHPRPAPLLCRSGGLAAPTLLLARLPPHSRSGHSQSHRTAAPNLTPMSSTLQSRACPGQELGSKTRAMRARSTGTAGRPGRAHVSRTKAGARPARVLSAAGHGGPVGQPIGGGSNWEDTEGFRRSGIGS